MCSSRSLKQNNDQVIIVPITREGVEVDTTKLLSAIYKLYSFNKKIILLEKELGSGISALDSQLSIRISKEDCKNLSGNYYHELTVTDATHGEGTAFSKEVTFDSTLN